MSDELRTKTGKVLTDADVQALADEAERGYDIADITATTEATTMRGYRIKQPNALVPGDIIRWQTMDGDTNVVTEHLVVESTRWTPGRRWAVTTKGDAKPLYLRPQQEVDVADIHKATPADADAPLTSCTVCKEAVRPVPGGQGPTWVHDATGAVGGSGASS